MSRWNFVALRITKTEILPKPKNMRFVRWSVLTVVYIIRHARDVVRQGGVDEIRIAGEGTNLILISADRVECLKKMS